METILKEGEAALAESQEKYESLQKQQSEDESSHTTNRVQLDAKVQQHAKEISNLEVIMSAAHSRPQMLSKLLLFLILEYLVIPHLFAFISK